MNLNLIKFFSFFIGLFIMLIILSFYKLNENITIPNNYIENFNNKINDNIEIKADGEKIKTKKTTFIGPISS